MGVQRLFLLAALALPATAAADVIDPQQALVAELYHLEELSGGTLGVGALNLASNERVRYNSAERFPMASTFKLPVALTLLDQVDRKKLTLEQVVAIDDGNLSPGSGELKTTEPGAGKKASVGELLKLMMRDSDNTATDHLLALVGGPAAVMEHLKALGLDKIDVSRPAAQLVADAWGFKLPPPGKRTRQNLSAMVRATPEAARVKAAHKTGTLTRVATNDVGIVSLSLSNGPAVMAIYLKGSPQSLAQQEHTLALAALAVYRWYTR